MKLAKFFIFVIGIAFIANCDRTPQQVDPGGYTGQNNTEKVKNEEAHEKLEETGRPAKIAGMMKERGAQDEASPTLKFLEPTSNVNVNGSTVTVKLELGGDLKGYEPGKNEATGMGNHIHVILDNEPYEAYYNLGEPFELKNVADGEHTLRVFPSRPWHESYKNNGAFQTIKFTVNSGGADTTQPVTTNSNQQMSNANAEPMAKSGAVDMSKPLLTYSRPKGEYKGEDAEAIMIDFWLSNAKLTGDGGQYKVRYTIDNNEPKFIEKWQPIWLKGFAAGTHKVKLELVDASGNLIENGGYNSTTRDITVVR